MGHNHCTLVILKKEFVKNHDKTKTPNKRFRVWIEVDIITFFTAHNIL